MPVIGFLHLTSRDETRGFLPDFHRGLADAGYIEGKNVAIKYRWGEGHNDRLPSLIAELVRRQVSVIVTLESTLAALAAKEATRTIPVIFMQGADPVRIGLVDSLSHPDGNITGINLFLAEVAAKRFEFLLGLVPGAKSVAYLRNRASSSLNHLVGGHEQLVRHCQAEHPGGLGVDDQLELARLHDRQLRWFDAFENAASVVSAWRNACARLVP
jgi:hypothetical protein